MSEDAVLELIETVLFKSDQSKQTVAIFLDCAKAFNSISHNVFPKKIEICGFSRKPRECCFDFSPTTEKKLNLRACSLIVKL